MKNWWRRRGVKATFTPEAAFFSWRPRCYSHRCGIFGLRRNVVTVWAGRVVTVSWFE